MTSIFAVAGVPNEKIHSSQLGCEKLDKISQGNVKKDVDEQKGA